MLEVWIIRSPGLLGVAGGDRITDPVEEASSRVVWPSPSSEPSSISWECEMASWSFCDHVSQEMNNSSPSQLPNASQGAWGVLCSTERRKETAWAQHGQQFA